jgi:tellurite methyltransferase
MEADRTRWNEKYRTQDHSGEASEIVQTYAELAAGGLALDIAAGTGKNSLFLAQKGFTVHAVDISDVAVQQMTGLHPRIRPIRADLDTWQIPQRRYHLIVNTRYLNRRLFPYIREGLCSGGILIFESFLEDTDAAACQPSCRDYLLRKNELLHAFLSLRVLFYREARDVTRGEPNLIASLVAQAA